MAVCAGAGSSTPAPRAVLAYPLNNAISESRRRLARPVGVRDARGAASFRFVARLASDGRRRHGLRALSLAALARCVCALATCPDARPAAARRVVAEGEFRQVPRCSGTAAPAVADSPATSGPEPFRCVADHAAALVARAALRRLRRAHPAFGAAPAAGTRRAGAPSAQVRPPAVASRQPQTPDGLDVVDRLVPLPRLLRSACVAASAAPRRLHAVRCCR